LRVAVAGDYLKDAATRLMEPLLLEDSGLVRFNLSPLMLQERSALGDGFIGRQRVARGG
jgi:hypothetical protein